jgi:hypothetical protein
LSTTYCGRPPGTLRSANEYLFAALVCAAAGCEISRDVAVGLCLLLLGVCYCAGDGRLSNCGVAAVGRRLSDGRQLQAENRRCAFCVVMRAHSSTEMSCSAAIVSATRGT